MIERTILLLDAGGTQTLPVAEYFYRQKYHVVFFLFKKYTYGSGSRYAHEKIFAPDANNEADYISFLLNYLEANDIDVIIPMSDVTAELVSKHRERLNSVSNVVAPTFSSFSIGYSKGSLMKLCSGHGFSHPTTVHIDEFSDIEDVKEDLLPLFLKPNFTTGGRGMGLVHSIKELREKAPAIFENFGPFHLQEFIPAGGNQYKVQLFRSKTGQIVASSVMHKIRYYPVNGGSSSYNQTIERNDLIQLCTAVLDKLEWVGFADFDLIEDPGTGEEKILEINPRLPACVKSAFMSGVNYAEMYLNEALNLPHKKYSYKPGYGLRHLSFDILWLVNSGRKNLKLKIQWFNFFSRKTKYQDLNISDMKSFFYGIYGNISNIR